MDDEAEAAARDRAVTAVVASTAAGTHPAVDAELVAITRELTSAERRILRVAAELLDRLADA